MGDIDNVSIAAYNIAWKSLKSFARLSRDERDTAPLKLREYIDVLIASGESDKEKIAQSALGLIREYEQIARSVARIGNHPGLTS